ncbi:MAG: Fe-S cluster assembly ATPase SufC [Candidatus Pacebacteria bacterium RIFCSPHIGHO2_01_FULL_46_10]|nr:MAG: Fe-S cluster assembly ATPase SufC [Candidatus Pacebacteria bacterium RIFCSPHIGHO2_01_FULL_46_10]
MLKITNLHVSVEKTPILSGVSLVVKPGEVHAIMGPNGSGKSTLAYTLAGHPKYVVTRGSVKLDKHNLLEMTPDERARTGLFLAFQYPVEIGGVSVQNFLRAAYEAKFGPLKSILEFREALRKEGEKVGVKKELLERNVNEGFSGGEKKRLEILQMMVLKPSVAVLDETDSGLDVDAIKTVARGVRAVIAAHNTGVIVITHYQRILKYLEPEFVHVMVKGKIVKSGGQKFAEELEKNGYTSYV